jgi:Zn-dependent protease
VNIQEITGYLITGIVALITIMLHEIAHGFAALKLGDTTAKDMGRLSLNPVRHVDIFGLLMLIIVGFGWAKPVPVDMRYFKNPKRGMAITALAGPLMNFTVAFVTILVIVVWAFFGNMGSWTRQIVVTFLEINIGLGIFNLFPIPPLDGSKILGAFLPERIYYPGLRHERYGMFLLMALLWLELLTKPLMFLRQTVLKAYLTAGDAIYMFVNSLIGG